MAFFLSFGDVALLVASAFAILYIYACRRRNYWKNQNVVHEDFTLIMGPIKRFSEPRCITDEARYKKMGRIFGIYELGKPTLIVADPDLVKQVLVKDFQLLPNRRNLDLNDNILKNVLVLARDDLWRRIRPLTSPAFSTGKLRKMNALIQDCVSVTCKHLEEAAENKRDVDLKQFYGHYTLDMIARCAFGTKLDSHTDATNEFVTEAGKAFTTKGSFTVLLSVIFKGLVKYVRPKVIGDHGFVYFKNVLQEIMRNRQETGKRHEDFLQLMMDAQSGHMVSFADSGVEASSKLIDIGSESSSDATVPTKRMTEDEALAQCILFFLGGQDTTSSTLALCVYFLAVNPATQEKLRREVDECIATHGTEPSLDVVFKLNYLNCVVLETLRLYPPLERIERETTQDYVLGETGIKIPKGCVIGVPAYAMHRDPEYFPEPEKFNPERFSGENEASIRAYTYLPFGAGPRNCIGMRLAMQAVKLCLLHSVHRVQFVRVQKTQVPLKIKNQLGLLHFEDITVGVRNR